MQKNICDNCDKEATQKRGKIIVRDYCDLCVVQIDKMIADIDKMHDKISDSWKKGLINIKKKYKGVLPDV